jgi:hypothetical protein
LLGRIGRVVGAACLTGILVLVASGSLSAAPGEDDTPAANPDLVKACGIDILVTLDASGSVQPYTQNVKDAFNAFTAALKNTGSRIAVSQFSTVATLPLGTDYTTVTDQSIKNKFDPYINSYKPNGSTNWEDGFRVDRYFLPRPNPNVPHLVVFITDGDPNYVIKAAPSVTYDPGNQNTAQNEYEKKVPLDSNEVASGGDDFAKDKAVSNSNAMKAVGSHVLVVAVGNGLNSSSSLQRIIDVSGPDVFSGSGTFDITTDDVYKEPDFSSCRTRCARRPSSCARRR